MKISLIRALNLTLFSVLLLFAVSLKAQTLHIYYNVFTDSVRYELDGKTVSKPRLRKGGTVYVHLLEYNQYIYSATVTLHDNPGQYLMGGTQAISADGMADMTGGTSSPLMGIFGALSSPMFNMPLMKMGDSELSLASFAGGVAPGGFAGTRGAEEQMLRETEEMLKETAQTEAELKKLGEEIRQTGRALMISMMINEQLDQIVYNPRIPPSQIKKLCKEYFSAMFGPDRLDSLSLMSSLDWTENIQSFRTKTLAWKNLNQTWGRQLGDLEQRMTEMNGMDWSNEEVVAKLMTINETVRESQAEKSNMDSTIQAAQVLMAEAGNIPPSNLANLYLRYKELMNNEFEYQDFFYMTGSAVALRVELVRRDTMPTSLSGDDNDDDIVKTRTFVVESFGGLKLSAGAGFNFAQFFDQPLEYSVNNDVIVGQPSDQFLPAIASQFLFYADRGTRMSFGGSFGIGLPVLAGDQAQAAMFFLGPCLVFGGGQRIVLTTGVLGGKTNQLAKGFAVGDPFDPSQGDIPTTATYQYGYFLGLSFNFSGR